MQRIINFILRNRSFLLFLFLLAVAFLLTLQNQTLHRSRVLHSANRISGSVYGLSASMNSYFGLRAENDKLLEENRRLRLMLFNRNTRDSLELDTAALDFDVITARIIKNSYSNPDNYLTLDKGSADSVRQDMGVITSRGILGIVERTSRNFASVQSILNTRSTINAKLAGTDYFGSLTWNRADPALVQLEDIPRLVPLKEGDTVVTGAMSSIFPENIPIGTIDRFDLPESQSFYRIDVRLFNDMTNLRQAYLIRNRNRQEILQLESEVRDDL